MDLRCGSILYLNLCMGISDKIEVATIAIDKGKILEIYETITWPFQSSLTLKVFVSHTMTA